MKEEWLFPNAIVPVDVETTAALVAEIHRLIGVVGGMALAQPEQEPVAHLWKCIGRWSAYLVSNGEQANCAPPSWLVDAVNNATAPPQRTWVGLTDEEYDEIWRMDLNNKDIMDKTIAKLKEKST